MLKQISQIGLLSVTLSGILNLPSFAQTTTSQIGNLEATVSGENNQVYQTINQTIINHPGRGSVRRNSEKFDKTPKKNSRSSYHRHSDDRKHPRKNDH
ncbi:MAG: hypothetical protein AAGF26_12335 [Cyanobacteria bacterium P01_G01_bin.49]